MTEPSTDLQPSEELAREIIERIVGSSEFETSKAQGKLLKFLYETRRDGLVADDIEKRHYKRVTDQNPSNPAHARNRISELKGRLKKYYSVAKFDAWVCNLPEPNGNDGYCLRFDPAPWTSTQRLWMQHLYHPDELITVTGSHLFFYNLEKKAIQRFSDFNEIAGDGDESAADADSEHSQIALSLKEKHPDANIEGFLPTFNMYLAAGEVHASEKISRWFYHQAGTIVERVTSREIGVKELHGKTPIYIGRSQTNAYIRTTLKSRAASHLAYRIIDSESQLSIKGILESERAALKGYDISSNGYVSGIPGYVFGLVARIKNPTGQGHITVITCNFYSPAISGVVEMLTNDKRADLVLRKVGWPAPPALPDSFEMLFRLPMPRGSREPDSLPELLCGRLHERALADDR